MGKDLQLEVKDACLPSPIMAEAEVLKNLSLDRGESCIWRHFLFESCSDHLAIFVVKPDATLSVLTVKVHLLTGITAESSKLF